jgi:magnesium-transporting ATPase (P-type)
MFNALNALSENQSLLTLPPWANKWVLAAIATSMSLHFIILYVPFLQSVFAVAPLGYEEWMAVIQISLPVIVIDEALKFVTRRVYCMSPMLCSEMVSNMIFIADLFNQVRTFFFHPYHQHQYVC